MRETAPEPYSDVEKNDPLTAEEREVLLELEEPLARVLEKLRPELERGEYRLIIGDDASGRIPALIVGEVVRKLCEEKGFPKPLIRFVAGSTGLSSYDEESKFAKVRDFFRAVKDDIESEKQKEKRSFFKSQQKWKALIVTDIVASGASVGVLVNALRENGIVGDIATVSMLNNTMEESLSRKLRTKVVGRSDYPPGIYRKERLHGVSKNIHDLFAEPLQRGDFGNILDDVLPVTSAAINESREVAHKIADRLVAGFHKNTQRGDESK